MIDDKQKSNSDSLNQSESDDAYWLENKIKEQLLQQSSNEDNGAREDKVMSPYSYNQSEESDIGFGGFETAFFNPPNFNTLHESQPSLPPGLGPVDKGFSRDPFTRNQPESQDHPFLLFSEPSNASELFKIPQSQMPKHSRFSHYEPEPVKSSLKSRLKVQSANFQPENDATPRDEHQNEEIEELEGDEENADTKNLENKIESKENLEETPENKETHETPEPEKNPYAVKIKSKREIEEEKRKKAAEAEAEAAAKKQKTPEVVVVHTKPADETPNHEHKTDIGSKTIIETPKNVQNKTPKPVTKQEHQQTKPHLHHENNGVIKSQSFKKEDSFKQATKHKKRGSFQQEKEVIEYVEKKSNIFSQIVFLT